MTRALVLFLCLATVAPLPAAALTADEQMRFADGIYLRGLYETAAAEYLLLLRDFPNSPHVPAALFRTGECYRQMGNQAGAERFYKRVKAEFPDSPQAPRAELRRAELAIAAGRPEEAATILNALLMENPGADTAAAAAYYLGLSRWKAGDRRGASAAYERLLADHPSAPQAAYAALDLAEIHGADRTRQKDVAAWFEKAVETAATPAAKAEALFRWGDWAYRRGDYRQAADLLQSLLMELPGERRARDARLAAAWSLFYLDRAAEALALAESLDASADPDTAASGWYLRANCLRKLNRDADALAAYETLVRDHPRSDFARRAAYEIMVTHFKRGQYENALLAAPAQPAPEQEADVFWMRAESERALGRKEAARARYQALIEQFPQAPQRVSALLRLGEMDRESGRFAEAAQQFRQAARETPAGETAAPALKASALARIRAGDAAGALEDWNELLTLNPEPALEAEARLQKALVLIELKKEEEALKELDSLLRDHPKSAQVAPAHCWRGVLLAEKSRWADAEAALRAALAAGPDAPTEALTRLRLAGVLQRQERFDEAADQVTPLLADGERVAENPALVEWVARRRFDQGQYELAQAAATALARHAKEPSWRQIGWYWSGRSRAETGRDDKARADFENAVAENARTREGAEAQLYLAAADLKAGRPEKAQERFAAAAEAAADDEAVDLRARAYFGLGEAAEAAGQLEKAARHFLSVAVLFDHPEWTPHSLYRAGALWDRLGKRTGRDQAWKELQERYPDSSFARQAAENP